MSLTNIDRLRTQQAHPRSVALWKALQPLKSCVSFMNTGAHPDDETTSMLAALGLRDGIKLSQACSTRGEGGQNALGVETIKNLGVLRTREMERAAEVIDMTQYWLSTSPEDSIFDFGFSKSGDETLDKWDEQRTLARFVLILRRERPDIVCPTFLDIPGQHGHHRAMTQSAFKAVKLAADPEAFKEQGLAPWQAKKLYLPAWSGAGDAYDDDVPPPPATLTIDCGGSDPVLGADYAQIAQWSRAFHATQGMGNLVANGKPNIWPLNLAWAATGNMGDENSIVENLPHDLSALAAFAGAEELEPKLNAAQISLQDAIECWPNYARVRENAVKAQQLISQALLACPSKAKPEVAHRLEAKRRQLARVLALASDVRARLSASQTVVRAGEDFELLLEVYSPDRDITPRLVLPKTWTATDWRDGVCTVSVGNNAVSSDPYPDTWFPDRANGPLHVELEWREGDQSISLGLDLEARLNVLPTFLAEISPARAIVNLSRPEPLAISLNQIYPIGSSPELSVPAGWKVKREDNQFLVEPTADLQEGLSEFNLRLDGHLAQTSHAMGYEHTGPVFRFEPATLRVRAMDVTLPSGRIAYVGGGSDRVDIRLRTLGLSVDTLDDTELEQADFGDYDCIIVGIFAFRTRPILARRTPDLHAWVRSGGNLVTLYHRPWDNWNVEHTGLARLQIGKPSLRWRVTDENAEVTHLVPDHALLNYPNKISSADWAGWQKERGLYFAADWDDAYTPLLSMADPSEKALTGSLLSGRFGKGRHTHTSLILHHQMEELVPGAYRLLANLLAPAT